jgi:hypothetical protein
MCQYDLFQQVAHYHLKINYLKKMIFKSAQVIFILPIFAPSQTIAPLLPGYKNTSYLPSLGPHSGSIIGEKQTKVQINMAASLSQ